MPAIRLVTVTNANATQLTASVYCDYVQVQEDNSVVNAPTAEFTTRYVAGNNNTATLPVGGIYIFHPVRGRPFLPGDIVGFIQTVGNNNTTTFRVDEYSGDPPGL